LLYGLLEAIDTNRTAFTDGLCARLTLAPFGAALTVIGREEEFCMPAARGRKQPVMFDQRLLHLIR
jgi:hypothetical protein